MKKTQYLLLSSIWMYLLHTKYQALPKEILCQARRGIFLGYSKRSKAYRVYNSETQCVEEFQKNKITFSTRRVYVGIVISDRTCDCG